MGVLLLDQKQTWVDQKQIWVDQKQIWVDQKQTFDCGAKTVDQLMFPLQNETLELGTTQFLGIGIRQISILRKRNKAQFIL